jgi:hypothetical protein
MIMFGDLQDNSGGKKFLLGVIGSLGGLLAMRLYWQYVAPLIKAKFGSQNSDRTATAPNSSEALNDIALTGRQYRANESATEALGRILYERVTGHEPTSDQSTNRLSYGIHWVYGMIQGGLYGALLSSARKLDLQKGAFYGLALWLLGDELVVPLLGLQEGPTAVSGEQHLNRFGAHLAYGLGTSFSTSLLRRFF